MERCAVCGSTDQEFIDGLMYCARCKTHIDTYQQYEAEDTMVSGRNAIRVKKKKAVLDKDNAVDYVAMGLETPHLKQKSKKRKFIELPPQEPSTSNLMKVDSTACENTSEEHLRVVGLRLVTFTKIIAKSSGLLVSEYNFPKNFKNTCFAIWQRYLKHCQVAFHEEEVTDDPETRHETVVLEKNRAFHQVQKAKKMKEKKKAKAQQYLNKSVNPLELLLGDTLDENLELAVDLDEEEASETREDITEESTSYVKVVTTNIHKSAFFRAQRMFLDMDLLIGILYIGAMFCGCKWVLLSDIIRWIREDRFFISSVQVNALKTIHENVSSANSRAGDVDFPLFEFLRTTNWLWQSIELPSISLKLDTKELLARLLFNLNLPTDFMENVLVLLKLSPISDGFSMEELKRQGSIEEGFTPLEYASKKDKVHNNNFALSNCFLRNSRATYTSDIFLPSETKLMALVLIALKMTFNFKNSTWDEEEEIGQKFSFQRWMYQLRMRLMVWEGYQITDVLQRTAPVAPLMASPPFGHGHNTNLYDQDVSTSTTESMTLMSRTHFRDKKFQDCVPNMVRRENACLLPKMFPEELCRSVNRTERGNQVLFAPLRFQRDVVVDYLSAARQSSEGSQLKKKIHKKAENVFLEDYGTCELNASGKKTFQTLFPYANNYKRFPRPIWAQAMVRSYLGPKEKRREGIDTVGSIGECLVWLSRKAASDVYLAAERYMDETFHFLLKTFAKVIGELDIVLYAAFLMAELQIVDRTHHLKMCTSIVEGRTIPLEYCLFKRDGSSKAYSGRISSIGELESEKQLKYCKLGYPEGYETETVDDEDFVFEVESESEEDEEEDEDEDEDINELSDLRIEESPEKQVALSEGEPSPSQDDPSTTISSSDVNEARKTRKHRKKFSLVNKRVYDWETTWHISTMRYW